MSPSPHHGRPATGGLAKPLCLLWLAGIALRMTLLAVPPVIPLVHEDLHMSETQIGLLIGLPLAVFATAAVPGSLLIARIGTTRAVLLGMTVAALAGGARGLSSNVWTLYAASIGTGLGIAIMQPGMPTLVREWLPNRIALGTIAYSNGMVVGGMLPPLLTFSLVLPLVGGSWRLALAAWVLPALLIPAGFFLMSPKEQPPSAADAGAIRGLWWPDWRNPLVWLLGLTFGSNNSPYFATNAFLGDFLADKGQANLLGVALSSLNGAQIIALVILLGAATRLQRRAWPFFVFGPLMLVSFVALMFVPSAIVVVVCAGLVGLSTAVTMTAILALPPLLMPPQDVPRTAAGMFTISYTCAIIIPTICGALWDVTGKAWTTFVPLCVCAVALAVIGARVARFPAAAAAPR
jgi:MFS transporter, CP family, cyanate transporter